MSDAPPRLPYRAEVLRKALHVGALLLPASILWLGRPTAALLLGVLAVVAVACDVARQRWRPAHHALLAVFAPIMRPEERPPFGGPLVLNGAVWMCVAAAATAALFPEAVAAAALAVLMVGDAAAALVGRRFGRTRYPGSPKSLEGTAAFAVAGGLAALPFALAGEPPVGLGVLAVGVLVAAAFEAVPFPVNDNVRVPLAAGVVMSLLTGVA
jgi:dolichol kinase